MKLWIVDPKTKEPSVTLTLLVSGFIVATVKLLVSGIAVAGVTLSVFSGGDFAAAIGALGGLYWARRNVSTGSAE